jgi:hypothetical protein
MSIVVGFVVELFYYTLLQILVCCFGTTPHHERKEARIISISRERDDGIIMKQNYCRRRQTQINRGTIFFVYSFLFYNVLCPSNDSK